MWTLIFSTHIDVAVFQLFCHRKVMTKFVFLSNSRAARKADNFRRRRMCVHVLLALMINSFCLYFRNQYFANLISCFTQRTDTNDGTFSSMRKQRQDLYSMKYNFCYFSSISTPLSSMTTSSYFYLTFQLPQQQMCIATIKLMMISDESRRKIKRLNGESSRCYHFLFFFGIS